MKNTIEFYDEVEKTSLNAMKITFRRTKLFSYSNYFLFFCFQDYFKHTAAHGRGIIDFYRDTSIIVQMDVFIFIAPL